MKRVSRWVYFSTDAINSSKEDWQRKNTREHIHLFHTTLRFPGWQGEGKMYIRKLIFLTFSFHLGQYYSLPLTLCIGLEPSCIKSPINQDLKLLLLHLQQYLWVRNQTIYWETFYLTSDAIFWPESQLLTEKLALIETTLSILNFSISNAICGEEKEWYLETSILLLTQSIDQKYNFLEKKIKLI